MSDQPVRYEVTLEVDPSGAELVERYMRQIHIPEILATGCFRQIRFERASPHRFRTCYEAASAADVDRYLSQHAEHFRTDFRANVGELARPSREIWTELQHWP